MLAQVPRQPRTLPGIAKAAAMPHSFLAWHLGSRVAEQIKLDSFADGRNEPTV